MVKSPGHILGILLYKSGLEIRIFWLSGHFLIAHQQVWDCKQEDSGVRGEAPKDLRIVICGSPRLSYLVTYATAEFE